MTGAMTHVHCANLQLECRGILMMSLSAVTLNHFAWSTNVLVHLLAVA